MATRRKPPPPPPRRRREPETARAEILDAAEGLLVRSPPGAVGLKEVAAAAGVSHALVSHYFGTYGELVESVLVRRIRRLRETALAKLAEPGGMEDGVALIEALFTALEDPLYVRLSLWALAAERPLGRESFPFREQGMRIFAEALTARVLRDRPDLPPGPLRDRPEDIAPIAERLVRSLGETHDRVIPLSRAARLSLGESEWPGNVRQLENVIQRGWAVALSEGAAAIEPRHLFPDQAGAGDADAGPATYEDAMRRYQGRFLREALEEHAWNVSETARRIGLARGRR